MAAGGLKKLLKKTEYWQNMGFLINKSTTINNMLQNVIRKLQGIAFRTFWYIEYDNWTQWLPYS